MNVKYRRKFLIELARIPAKTRNRMEEFVFFEVPNAMTISEINKVEKLKGYSVYYKVRFGSYRIGIKMEVDTIIFERVMHRKDIYRYFP